MNHYHRCALSSKEMQNIFHKVLSAMCDKLNFGRFGSIGLCQAGVKYLRQRACSRYLIGPGLAAIVIDLWFVNVGLIQYRLVVNRCRGASKIEMGQRFWRERGRKKIQDGQYSLTKYRYLWIFVYS